jgi:D-tyrosyl-tRNA(Tyr) deacylase
MRAILQRVIEAAVKVENETVAKIGKGWLVLLGIGQEDGDSDLSYIVDKTINLRGFADAEGKMNLSLIEISGEILVVSQFTLYGDCRKGRRPSFTDAGSPVFSKEMYESFIDQLRTHGIRVSHGVFQADMKVSLVNDGPVSFILDSSKSL